MSRQIAVKAYQRRFCRPLRTARGEWELREGYIIRVERDRQIGYGEIAPLPEFGSETVAEAGTFLQELVRQPQLEVPDGLPCCACGLSAASLIASSEPRDYAVAGLLSAGAAALEQVSDKVGAGYRSFKWKIGVEPIDREIALAHQLMSALPAGARLRFDANASLSSSSLEQWLDLLVLFPEQTDYLEQPLACGREDAMAAYMQATGVPIALDESLNAAAGGRWLEPGAWAGPLVVKPGLMGDVVALAAKLAPVAAQVVFSSIFETGIGLENSLRVADSMAQLRRPIGFDTLAAFDDDLQPLKSAAVIRVADRQSYTAEQIWDSI